MIKQLMIRFGLIVPIVEEEVVDDDKQSYLVPALLPVESSGRSQSSAPSFTPCNTFFVVFSTDSSFIADDKIISAFDIKTLGFLPRGLFSRLLAKTISWCQITTPGICCTSLTTVIYSNMQYVSRLVDE